MVQNIKNKQKSKEKIKLAIIGGSYDSTIAKTHLRSILSTGKYEIICGCFSKKKNKNLKNSQFYSIPKNKIYNNLKKLIYHEFQNIDLALVLTPPNDRHIIYHQLASKNIGIIAEKPFEGDYKKAQNIYKFIKKKKIFFISTYNYLGYPAIMEIKPLLKRIGNVNNFILEMPQQASTLKNTKIKKWRTKDKTIPNLHLDLASHLLSLVIYIFGQLPLMVNSFENKNNNYIDNAYTWLKFKKFVGQFWYSKNSTGKTNEISIKIFGSKGSIEWTHAKPEEILFSNNVGDTSIINRTTKKTKYLKNNNFFTYSPGHPIGFLDTFINIYEQIHHLYKNKKTDAPILMNLKDNLNIISILNKIHFSSIKKKWQKTFL
jgi:predicted dehydrogenase